MTSDLAGVMPLGLALVDLDGVIVNGNERLAEMIDIPLSELLGRSMLDFVEPDDADFAGEILAAGLLFTNRVMGPVRIRYRDSRGTARYTEFWAKNCVETHGGYVLTFSDETVADKLSDAVRSLARNEPVEETLGRIASALDAHPVVARASILVVRNDELVPIGDWPIDRASVDGADPSSPWRMAVRHSDQRDFVGLHGLPPELRRSVTAAGYQSVWVRSITADDGHVHGALVVWREDVGWASPNQERRMADAVAIASLAFDQAAYRSTLERAVYVDALTGVGNRAWLHSVLHASDTEDAGVLYVDLDGFKAINDCHGHDLGDAVLVEVATRLKAVVRDGDEVIRIGGDEFVVVCRAAPSVPELEAVAARVVTALSEPYVCPLTDELRPVTVTGSVGIAPVTSGASPEERIRLADAAMYAAKSAGKACWRLAS